MEGNNAKVIENAEGRPSIIDLQVRGLPPLSLPSPTTTKGSAVSLLKDRYVFFFLITYLRLSPTLRTLCSLPKDLLEEDSMTNTLRLIRKTFLTRLLEPEMVTLGLRLEVS
jgi:hypothetical protein